MSTEASRITDSEPCLPPFSKGQERSLIEHLLRDVSRSFYLTLRVLPAEIRPQISLAYLLARASDTIADTKAVPKRERIEVLRQFAAGTRLKLAVTDGSPAEQRLLAKVDECVEMLASLSNEDQHLIRALHQTIVSGQIFDLEKFPREHGTELVALANDKELDRYTYLVAGCVGEFWTKMCRTHLPGLEALSIDDGVRFGKGLQLVNILRDLPKDLRIGRCYLPMSEPALLIEPNNFTTVEHIYRQWLDIAVEHLDAGWRYTLAIPANQRRLRLACVWPIWIGLKTIARLRRANPLDTSQRVKVSRPEVYWIMLESALLVGNDAALDEVYQRLRLKTGR